jgi:hypothetical protein
LPLDLVIGFLAQADARTKKITFLAQAEAAARSTTKSKFGKIKGLTMMHMAVGAHAEKSEDPEQENATADTELVGAEEMAPAGPRRHASGSHLHTRSTPNLGTIKGLVNMNIKAQAAQQELRRASELPSMPGFVEEKHNKTNKGNEHVAKLWTKAKKIRSQVSGPESTADSATPFATVATAPAVPRPVKNTENGAGDTVNLSPVQIEGSGPDACIDPEASITVMHASDYQACAAPRSTPPGADIQFSSRKMHLPPLPISHDQSASPSPRSTLVDSPRRW